MPSSDGAFDQENVSPENTGESSAQVSDSDAQTQESPEKTQTGKRRAKRWLIAGALCAALIGSIAAVPAIWFHFNKLPDIRMLESFKPVQSIKIYDKDSKLIVAISANEDRRPVLLNQVSQAMRKAMIGAEDHDFYKHGGINPSSIFRALIVNWKAHRIVEGGSTITQQLVKNLFFPGEKRTINRKIKEFFLATQVDRKYSKDRILEMYLNQIYFGNQSYGVESAAQRYFTKPASQLTLAESAFLAGLVRSPSYLSNPAHRGEAFIRQKQVLDEMLSYGMITRDEANAAKQEHLRFRKFVNPYQRYPFYLSYVIDELHDHFGDQELQHGMNVYTYLDPAAQALAESVINEGIAHAPNGVKQGAIVSLRVADAGVVSMVGGVGSFEDHQWNRAVSPHTMGSSFKPFVYLTGFMHGLTPDSIVQDAPFSAPSGGQWYSPRNFDNRFFGPLTIKMALTQSRNVCAVRIAYFVGILNVINTAHLAGITSRLDPYLPTAVGACAASPLEMAGAYSTFARGGIYLTPHLVRRVESPDGRAIYTYDEKPKKIFDSQAVSSLLECMQNVVQHGTGIYAQLPNRPVAGKTGTADKSKDIWFIGFTPDTCTACWGGNDHNKAINNRAVTGGMVMAGIWKKYMLGYYDLHPTLAGSFMVASKDPVNLANIVPPNMLKSTTGASGTAADNDKGQATAQDGSKSDRSASSSDATSAQAASASTTRRKRMTAHRSEEEGHVAKPAAAAPAEAEKPVEENKPEQSEPAPTQPQAAVVAPVAPAAPRMFLMRSADGRLFMVPVRQVPARQPVAPAVPRIISPIMVPGGTVTMPVQPAVPNPAIMQAPAQPMMQKPAGLPAPAEAADGE